MLVFLCLALVCAFAAPPSTALVPAMMGPHTDKLGNEWNLEQNGMIGGHRSGSSLLSSAMTLSVGPEQFYGSQPMATADGREMVFTGQQPTQGLQITRRIRYLDKEGGLLYLDLFNNPSTADVSGVVEYRQTFSGSVKTMLTDAGRAVRGSLEKEEAGFVILPGSAGGRSYGFLVCAPRSTLKPTITTQSQYQLSTRYSVTVPAGKTIAILQAVMQSRLSLRPDSKELEKMFRPFSLLRHLGDWPKNLMSQVINVRGSSPDHLDLASWFPDEFLGVKREALDVLAMGEGTRLRGKASCARLTLQHRLGKIAVPWEKVVALAGGRRPAAGAGRIYLSDGQILTGPWQAEELRFEMNGGLRMDLKSAELDVLVRGAPAAQFEWPKNVVALVETWNGERFAVGSAGHSEISLTSAWGPRKARLPDLSWINQSADEGGGTLAQFNDGSRLRVWTGGDNVELQTALFGEQKWPVGSLRAMACRLKPSTEDAVPDEDPTRPFVDLSGEQRLMAAPSDALLHLVTAGGVVPLDSSLLREMRNVTEEAQQGTPAAADDTAIFQVQLWGGGSVLGRLRESGLHFAVGGADWFVPGNEIVRLVNPTPKITDSTLARIGTLLRDLGNDDWKTREKASAELKSLGELAKPSLQEALKQTEDAEVKRRIEQLLGEID
jgi:hypothetical protein